MDEEVPVPIVYDGLKIDIGFRLDLLVESLVVVESKTVTKLTLVHQAQLLSHLRLLQKSTGLLINFHVSRLKHGIKRVAN